MRIVLFDETGAGRITRSCAAGSTEALGTFAARFHNPSSCGYDVFFADGRAFGSSRWPTNSTKPSRA